MTDVLIVGAGPTGLTLATAMRAQGVRVRVVERRLTRRPSRAFIVHPRTLEQLAFLDLADEVVARGNPTAQVRLHAGSRDVAVDLRQHGMDATSHPFLLPVAQAAVEEVLEQHLQKAGVVVERGVEATSLHQDPDGVDVHLKGKAGTERLRVPYVAGCDGIDSTVRHAAGIPFPGRYYRQVLLLADVEVERALDPDAIHAYVGGPGILVLLPMVAATGWRLLAVDPEPAQAARGTHPRDAPRRRSGREPDLARLQVAADRFTRGTLRIARVTWAEEVTLRRAQADRYRAGRILLAGDAAHVHSPAGGQGMNTGIQDACNLAWKLALVTTEGVGAALLDAYQAERWTVARRTRQATDLAFLVEAHPAALLRLARRHLAPLLLPAVRGRTLPGPAFRLLGGLAIHYRSSPIVAPEPIHGSRRGPRPGDRLPDGWLDCDGTPRRLHELLRPPGFHLLLCGRTEEIDRDQLRHLSSWAAARMRLHDLNPKQASGGIGADEPLLRRLGVHDAASILVRPDGYVAWRADGVALDGLMQHLGSYGGTEELPSRPQRSGL